MPNTTPLQVVDTDDSKFGMLTNVVAKQLTPKISKSKSTIEPDDESCGEFATIEAHIRLNEYTKRSKSSNLKLHLAFFSLFGFRAI